MKKITMVLRVTILVAILMAVMFVSPGQAYKPSETELPERIPEVPDDPTKPGRIPEIVPGRGPKKIRPRRPLSPEERAEEEFRRGARRVGNPDLVIRIDSVGTPTAESRRITGGETINVAIPIILTVRNIGGVPVTEGIYIGPETQDNNRYGAYLSIPGVRETGGGGRVIAPSLGAGDSIAVSGTLDLWVLPPGIEEYRRMVGTRVRVRVGVDNVHIHLTGGLIQESNENNNFSEWRTVTLPSPVIR